MLGWADWQLNRLASNVDEASFIGMEPEELVRNLAVEKSKTRNGIPDDDFVIAADTIVVFEDEVLGKPADSEHAFQILARLRGRMHQVMTAIAVRRGGQPEPVVDICRSAVKMRDYSDVEIREYIQSGDPMDKAGAYAIQNREFDPVVNFGGCMASVMGLPLCHLERTLRKFEDYAETDWPGICQFHLKYDCPITHRVMAGEDIG